MGSSPAGPLPRVGLFDRLLDRHRFPVLPPSERRTADASGEAPVVCRMIFEELCVLATGEIVCSCGDPAGLAVYGNVHSDRIEEVFRGRRYRRMRRWQLSAAPGSFCPVVRSRCGGRVSRATALDTEEGRAIKVLQLEPTSRCNLRCPGCPVSNFRVDHAYRPGRTATLPLATMLGVVDQLPDLEKLLFYDFGEPFLHPDAVPFLREVRRRRPEVTLHASTNGLALTPEAIAAIAGEALADRVVFSIDGASEGPYRRYRRGGSFEKARRAVASLAEECARAGTRERVDVVWQYILFEWNDGDEEIARARTLAAEAGARLSFVVTHTPGASRRYVDGSPATAHLLAGATCTRRSPATPGCGTSGATAASRATVGGRASPPGRLGCADRRGATRPSSSSSATTVAFPGAIPAPRYGSASGCGRSRAGCCASCPASPLRRRRSLRAPPSLSRRVSLCPTSPGPTSSSSTPWRKASAGSPTAARRRWRSVSTFSRGLSRERGSAPGLLRAPG
ncbi:MAG: radical SAM protein [Holophagales bacterium]|nr:radical SAM protein [Holophagales bacterium]